MKSLLFAIFSAMLGLGVVVPLLPIYAKYLGASTLMIGLIYSSFSFARTTFTPIFGILSDRLGRKIFILIGLSTYTIVSILYILARSAEDLAFIRFIHGICSAMVIPCAMAYAGHMAKRGEEGRTISNFNLSFLTGIGFGPFLGGLIKDLFGIKFAFLIMALLTALSFLTVLIYVPNVRDGVSMKFTAIFDKKILSLMIFRFSTALRISVLVAFLPILFLNFSGIEIGSIVSTMVLSNAISQKIFARKVDISDRVKLATFGGLIAIAIFLSIPFIKNFYIALSLALIMGIFNGIATCSVGAIAIDLGRIYGHGSVMGFYNTAMGMAMFLSPILAGYIADRTNLINAFEVIGMISLACLFIFSLLIRLDEVRICRDKSKIC